MGQYGLPDWTDVESRSEWPALLAGNGTSRAVSSTFAYSSLFDAANLTGDDRALFEELRTQNFEEVLRTLQLAEFVSKQLGHDLEPIVARYAAVRHALIEAVNQTHVVWDDVHGHRLAAIKTALHAFRVVYTTSYDLVFYWAMNQDGANDFIDQFGHPPNFHFEAHDSPGDAGKTVVHWVHGALQIYRWNIDGTAKRLNNGATLLTQFADNDRLPLYVAEGTAVEKRSAIRRSDYLSYCFRSLEEEGRDLVIFGQQLGDSDEHLVGAVVAHPDRQIAYGVYPVDQHTVDVERRVIARRLDRQDVKFFDSTTHPLVVRR